MADTLVPVPLISRAGIKRDGTLYEGEYYTDGEWVRFDRGLPRKMWGWRQSSGSMHGPSRGMLMTAQGGDTTFIHNGWGAGIERIQVTESGLATGLPLDRTPPGFVVSDDNLWIMDTIYNSGGTNTAIVAVAPPSATNIASTVQGTIYYGDLALSAPLAPLNPIDGPASTSGGLFVVPPYLFVYCCQGYFTWSVPNQPTTFATSGGGGGVAGARIAKSKLVAGMALRGGPGNSPAALIWSLDSLIRMSFVGGTAVFDFDTISTDTTVLSQKCIVEIDGIYFWPGIERFYMFNGVVRELPNEMNRNWFFDNMNWNAHEKSFSFVNRRWGEIWFCFPYGNATECTHACIYNWRYDTWYDTVLPGGGRSAGQQAQILRFPMMMGSTLNQSGLYDLWQHEYGLDEVTGGMSRAVRSYFDTADFSFPSGTVGVGNPMSRLLDVQRVEIDMILSGAISLTPKTKSYPMADTADGPTLIFDPADFDPADPLTYAQFARQQGRLMRWRFESNVLGGDYVQGNTWMEIRAGDVRQT